MTYTQGLVIAGVVLLAPHLSNRTASVLGVILVAALAAQWVYA
ncbi:hypothetical protein [Pusillimonas sp. ANT_WB101]|nr:hypothetical protein [Pusillimonas sp. ANT_WB101]